jgi:hypothetical protein
MSVFDRLVSKLYDELKINLLKVPRPGIVPGEALLGSGHDVHLIGPVPFASLLAGKPALTRPGDPQPSGKFETTVSSYKKVKAHASFFGDLLSGFLPGLKGKVEASATADADGEFCFRFTKVSQRSINVAAFQRALQGTTFDQAGLAAHLGERGGKIFLIVDTFTADGVQVQWRDGAGSNVSADIALENIAKLGGSHAAHVGEHGSVVVDGRPDTVFGVRLMQVEETANGPAIKLEHSRMEVLGGEREVDLRDYAMIAESGISLSATSNQASGQGC